MKNKTPESPECVIAEQLALLKLFLAQAKIDSITISEATINQQVESRIAYFTEQLGSKEKVEAYFKKPLSKMREELKSNAPRSADGTRNATKNYERYQNYTFRSNRILREHSQR